MMAYAWCMSPLSESATRSLHSARAFAIAGLAALALAGCGGGDRVSSASDANAEVREIVAREIGRLNLPVSVNEANCVKTGSGAFECAVTLVDSEAQTQTVGGTLTCDDDGCLWRGQLAGG